MLAEVVGEHPLPRVELEHRGDPVVAQIAEHVEGGVPADVLDLQPDGVEPGLGGGLLQVADGDVVLARCVAARPREVQLTAGQPALSTDQRSTSCSWIEFHWSSPGWVSFNQFHCRIEASSRVVGVSALYSSSFAGPLPS